MTVDAERLRRLLGPEDLRWLVDRMRCQLAEGRPLTGSVTLSDATEAQRQAVGRLLGRPVGRGASLSVWLPKLEETLRRAGLAPDLPSAATALLGPIANRPATRAAEAAAWESAFEPVAVAAATRSALADWADRVRATGILRRLAPNDPGGARRLAEQAVAVLDRLPAAGVPLSVLASTAAGGGHALDEDRPLSTLVLQAAAVLGGVHTGDGAEWRRTVWASAGVLCQELTSPVLTLNLPGDASTVTGRALAVWREAGQPVHLTVRQILRHPPELRLHGRPVFVCENPATLLLRRLAEAGATLRYHGDFDWAGLAIANGLVARFGARPWRLDAAAYRSAVTAAEAVRRCAGRRWPRGGTPL